jgi:diguanylate cyclase (GGDEF)-like protein
MRIEPSQAERETRLAQFLGRLAPVAAIFGLAQAWAATRFRERAPLASAAVFLLFAGCALVAGRLIGRGRLPLASAITAAALVAGAFLLVWLQPELHPTLVAVPLLAVVVALPDLGRRALRALLVAAVGAVGAIAWLGSRLPPSSRLPPEFAGPYGTAVAVAVAACVVYLLWQYGARAEARIHDERGRRERLEALIRELSGRERAARRAALRDPLTGLANRRLLLDRLEQAMGGLAQGGHQVGLLFLDLDRFKAVNDRWGHAAGDRFLAGVASRLAASVRSTDTLARLGGDELVLVMPRIDSPFDAERAARRLLERATQPLAGPWGELAPALSVGLAVAPDHAQDAAALLRAADDAMYRAKSNGGGLAWFDDQLRLPLAPRAPLAPVAPDASPAGAPLSLDR